MSPDLDDLSWQELERGDARGPRPEHAGSRVRFDGRYGTPGHLRQLQVRSACGPSSNTITFAVWNVLVGLAGPTDDYLLCTVCRPEVEDDPRKH